MKLKILLLMTVLASVVIGDQIYQMSQKEKCGVSTHFKTVKTEPAKTGFIEYSNLFNQGVIYYSPPLDIEFPPEICRIYLSDDAPETQVRAYGKLIDSFKVQFKVINTTNATIVTKYPPKVTQSNGLWVIKLDAKEK